MRAPRPAGRWRRCGGILAALALLLASIPARAQDATLEFAVKAQFLYKLGPFVEWPAQAYATGDGPITLCIGGADPFGPALDQAVAGQKIGDRPIAVVRLAAIGRNSGCHILYIANADPRVTAQAIEALRGMPVLTVTDGIRDPQAKGVINFVIQSNRVRFEIDDAQAAANGLEISSKVLSLAVAVKPRS